MRADELRKLQAFARGEATWAEVEGITAGDAERIARTGVELAAAGRLREAALIFEAMVEMNPLDARKLKLKPHDRVDVVSARSRVSRM